MAKALPLKHWLALEDDVNRHKAEVAQQFAEARARLLPPDPPKPEGFDWRLYLNEYQQAWYDACAGGMGMLNIAPANALWRGLGM